MISLIRRIKPYVLSKWITESTGLIKRDLGLSIQFLERYHGHNHCVIRDRAQIFVFGYIQFVVKRLLLNLNVIRRQWHS
jgi:hypothetical protein